MVEPVDDIDQIQQRFAAFVETTRRRAPLYATLADRLATEPERARVLLSAASHQRVPVLFFAAVHMSLMADPDHRLCAHYPSLGGQSPSDRAERNAAWEALVDLLDRRKDELEAMIGQRRVQTNEVGRGAVLRTALATLPADRPIRLIELGAAAGINLALDRFRFEYSGDAEVDAPAGLTIGCEVRGVQPPIGPIATVTDRIGIDSMPIDLDRAEDRRWLRACVWADETERLERLDRAIDVARTVPIRVHNHDLRDDLTGTLRNLIGSDAESTTVVITSWVLAYLDDDEQRRVLDALDEIGRSAEHVKWVCFEHADSVPILAEFSPQVDRADPASALVMTDWMSGVRATNYLARCHPHGHWIEWFDTARDVLGASRT